MRQWVRWSALLCLSLLLWTAAAESTHHHPSQTEAASCPICVVAHSARPALSFDRSAPAFAALGMLHEDDALAKAQLDYSERGIRGPPAVL